MALMIEATLGLNPWDVFHQGVAERAGWTFGTVTIVVGALVLLLWIRCDSVRDRHGEQRHRHRHRRRCVAVVGSHAVVGGRVIVFLAVGVVLNESPVARTSGRTWGPVHGMG